MAKDTKKDIYDEMVGRWPSAIVARTSVGAFTGGLVTDRYLACLDAEGHGPKRIKVGRKVAYRAEDLAAWLRRRAATGSLGEKA